MPTDRQPRILIVRLSAIGDCILTMPLLSALRRQYPEAFLAWVSEPGPAKLLRGHKCLDELIVVRKGWLKSPSAVWRLRRQLRGLRFDIAIDPQGLSKSAAAAWLSAAKRRIGFGRPRGRELSTWLNNDLYVPVRPHLVDCQLDLLRPLGIMTSEVQFGVPVDASAEESIGAYLAREQLGGPFAVINPGAGWNSKVWPAERFGQVAAHLGSTHGLRSVVVWAGEQERRWAELIVSGANGPAALAPPTTLPELAALLRRAVLAVTSDSGPMHLAAAVGTTCVGLFGPTRPEDCGPYGPGHITLQEYYQAGTSRQRRKATNDALRAISAGRVCAACDLVLARRQVAT